MPPNPVDHLRRVALPGDDRTDADLLAALLRKDPAAVEAVIHRHGPMVWGVCRRALGHHDAEDAFQATFLVLARRAEAVRPPGLLGNWLYGVARRTALKARTAVAKRARREAIMADVPEPSAIPSDDWVDLRPVLDQELERLPARLRAPLVLCDLEGLTRPEAARRLAAADGTVASRLAAGRRKLADRLARRGIVLSGAPRGHADRSRHRPRPASVVRRDRPRRWPNPHRPDRGPWHAGRGPRRTGTQTHDDQETECTRRPPRGVRPRGGSYLLLLATAEFDRTARRP